MPTAARPHIVAAEKIVQNPLQDSDEAYHDATQYIAGLPEELEGHAGGLRKTFRRYTTLLPTLNGPREVQECSYLRGKLIGIALQIGFYTGDLKTDWRN